MSPGAKAAEKKRGAPPKRSSEDRLREKTGETTPPVDSELHRRIGRGKDRYGEE